ncbi:MAG: hypothetical protein LBV18_05435 [Alistipes sp.]|jgi:hypothetical protein|nr:hypothetical protein [Alistipes sp.]
MKKLILMAAMVAVTAITTATAQELDRHSRDYSSLLPQKGDLATGIDLAGAAKFIGNSFADNKAEGNAITPFGGANFFAKYFIADNIALRARLGFGVTNITNREFVVDDAAYALDPMTPKEVTDAYKTSEKSFDLGVGIEFRRSLRRVQGYAGAELFIGTLSEKHSYEYGNAITQTNQNPTSYWGGYGERDLEEKMSGVRGGLSIFTGVDYFISRNVSMGFEFGLTGYGTSIRPVSLTTEMWDTVTNAYKKETDETNPKQGRFDIAPTAGLNMMFYF